MLLTIQAKVVTDIYAGERLLKTMEEFNKACNHISEFAWNEKIFGKIRLQQNLYYKVREQFNLSAQMTVRAIAKVSESYRIERNHKHTFKEHGAIVYDQRILSFKALDKISLLTLDGRSTCPVLIGGYRPLEKRYIRGQADLCYRNGEFFLYVVVDVPEQECNAFPTGIIGVDMGIVNIATTSEGKVYSGDQATRTRKKYAKLKASLQSVGTWNAKKHLKNVAKKERRFKKNLNHTIAKDIVSTAKDTTQAIAIEDLDGIRQRGNPAGKAHRDSLDRWAFHELRSFIEYKAKIAGVPVYAVDPHHTSQMCPICGHTSKANRRTQADFACTRCGHTMNADLNAAINIQYRAAVNQPIALRPELSFREVGSASQPALAVGS